ncbi:hypothetical protein LINPERPRIM_LOCUS10943 [Linum perenne]
MRWSGGNEEMEQRSRLSSYSGSVTAAAQQRRSEADDGPFQLHRRRDGFEMRWISGDLDWTATTEGAAATRRQRRRDESAAKGRRGGSEMEQRWQGDGSASAVAARWSDGSDDKNERRRRHEVKGVSV